MNRHALAKSRQSSSKQIAALSPHTAKVLRSFVISGPVRTVVIEDRAYGHTTRWMMQDLADQKRDVTVWVAGLVMAFSLWTCAYAGPATDQNHQEDGSGVERGIPAPRSDHPGNVYLETEKVSIVVPAEVPEETRAWRALDDRGRVIDGGQFVKASDVMSSPIELGPLPIGWYRIEFLDEQPACVHWTTAAVLKTLRAPVPQDSPICVDSATAWFAKDQPEDQARLASLAALAGVNWVRDRLTWRELEPKPDEVTNARTTYDSAAEIQTQYGLNVLQVFHTTPDWAWNTSLDGTRPGGRFPRDLRDVYRFCQAMGARFKGRVHAWEPWNEANVSTFGGHTVDEMCAFQKAAYLGFKAGDPTVTVCWNPYTTVPTPQHTQGLLDNAAWPYFDTYNIHTYEWAHDYASLWAPARQAACGKPMWVTEADRGIKYVGAEPWCELSQSDELRKAQYMAQSYASSLYAGSDRHFQFVLGHYYEPHNGVQFGLLRKDMTPRPAYAALAAVGRLLAGATCLGRWDIKGQPDAHVIVFRATPDGLAQDVLVAWAEKKVDWPDRGKTRIKFGLPESWHVTGAYDYLGRRLNHLPSELTGEALFVVLPAGQTDEVALTRIGRSSLRQDERCPIVLQVQMPRRASMKVEPLPWSQAYEYRIEPDTPTRLSLYAYNFSDAPLKGTLRVKDAPAAWVLDQDVWSLSMDPMQRTPFETVLTIPKGQVGTVQLTGDFGSAGKSVLAFRIHGKKSK